MSIILLSFLMMKDTNEIVETLSPMELEQLNELPKEDLAYAVNCLKNGTPQIRSNWNALRSGELFSAPDLIHIDQIVDKSNFLGSTPRTVILGNKLGEVIADDINSHIDTVWVEGVNTSTLSDGKELRTRQMLFSCVGNKQYQTAAGLKTVIKVVRVKPEGALKVLRAIAEPRGYRVWGEGGGGHLLLAKYLRSSSRTVTIQPLSGNRKTIEKKNLTPVDAAWVTEQEDAK